ncbi:sorting nexin-13 [Macrosteles quadrilineatus]|uniref:sorting nexin-13 n=1 Tax=Macrosteles quadrilineatus TaxID=74068 RepID=UPI0023E2253E|nr:sorting nexin-13 [Macrosteles quadrilineatus]
MNITLWGWMGLTLVLFITTFGFIFCLTATLIVIFILIGGLALLFVRQDKTVTDKYRDGRAPVDIPGLYKIVSAMKEPPRELKADRRLTGSQIIDDQLQEILTYLIRDYVYPWYDPLSADEEAPHQIRILAQRIIVSFASRMKEIDWIPYLTTRLVDDAASHLRLFRQARAKMKGGGSSSTGGGGHGRMPSGGGITPPTLESVFFDLELTMEENNVCRDHICLDSENEKSFLRELTQVILYLLTTEEDFHCGALCCLVREICVNQVLVPIMDLVSDPDYINQIIIWLCKDIPVTSEVFLTTLRVTDNMEELSATRELLVKEMSTLRSRDSGGDDDTWVKQQLSSLAYVQRIIESRLARLEEGADTDSADLPTTDYSKLLSAGHKLFMLPLDVILKNNVALSYFIDYMSSVGAQAYLFFYLNVEGWRVSVEQQMSDLALQKLRSPSEQDVGVDVLAALEHTSTPQQVLDRIREAAYSIFEQYLSEKASPRLRIEESLVKRLLLRIRTETPVETWFDEVQAAVYEKLQTEEKFLNGFRNNVAYVKLLAELELLKEPLKSDDEDTGSVDELSLGSTSETASLSSLTLTLDHREGSGDSVEGSNHLQAVVNVTPASPTHSALTTQNTDCKGPYMLSAEIIETGVVNEKGKTFGIYAMSVTKKYDSGSKETWHIYRRYSDFYELHQKVRDKYADLGKLQFPGKKTFHNMDRRVLERRMKMLNDYLQTLLHSSVLASHPSLRALLLTFLEPGDYDKGVSGGQIVKTLDNLLVNPLKAVVGQTVRTLPDNLLSTVDGVMDGLSKVLQYSGVKPSRDDSIDAESCKVGASLDIETDDNIPLRIMLLMMTEVFELKSRNQWLRRRIVTLLRQIVRTMFGDIVNRRIVDYVFALTSPHQVADYLRSFKHSYWPHGLKAEPKLPRDEMTRARTRVAAKIALLSSLSDELKHILGSETSRRGLLSVFQLFQHRVLNRRLLYVLLEGVLTTLFSHDHPLEAIFTRLHSRSPRVVKNNLARAGARR